LLELCQVNWTLKLPRTGIPSISRTKPSSSKTGTTWRESFLSWELVVALFWRYSTKLVMSCLFAVKDTCIGTTFEKSHFIALMVARGFRKAKPPMHILQVGCGVGNTAFPLLELNKQSRVYACDFAPSAVEMVKANPQYSSQRMHAFVADITCDDLRAEVPVSIVDMCTMVFVLSAITPAKMPAVRAVRTLSIHQPLSLPVHLPTRVPISVPICLPIKACIAFLRFRLNCHSLPVETGRHHKPPIPRSCRLCPLSSVGDEYHLVFECPIFQPLRDKYHTLFNSRTSLPRRIA